MSGGFLQSKPRNKRIYAMGSIWIITLLLGFVITITDAEFCLAGFFPYWITIMTFAVVGLILTLYEFAVGD